MSFAPPPGPPPPSVPEGWTTQFDDNYKQWFYINLATGRSQWEPPQQTPALTPQPPAQSPIPPSEQPHNHPDQSAGAPPSYEESGPGNPSAVASAEGAEKKNHFSSNNPYHSEPGTCGPDTKGTMESDAELAARLQAEEDARSRPHSAAPGAAAGYYNSSSNETPMSPVPSGASDRDKGKEKKKGLFSKLLGKASSSSSSNNYVAHPPHHHHQQAAYGYPPQGYGSPSPGPGYGAPGGYYPPQQGYGPGYGPQPGYGYPPQGYGMRPQRRQGGGGMGMAGAAALGVGGGLIGGALLADAIDDDHDHDDYGGGDDFGGGGDFGGDF
ncbi:hypothetical protein BDV19DRAFT_395104 [Aspergillus venezuelensis]